MITIADRHPGKYHGTVMINGEEGTYFKDEDGNVTIVIDTEYVPRNVKLTLTIHDGDDSQYTGIIDDEGNWK